jgi:hypothetical protein
MKLLFNCYGSLKKKLTPRRKFRLGQDLEHFSIALPERRKRVRLFNGLPRGCQIFLGTTTKMGGKYIKLPQNVPNGFKIYKTIKYTNIFHYKTLQNLPKIGFLV